MGTSITGKAPGDDRRLNVATGEPCGLGLGDVEGILCVECSFHSAMGKFFLTRIKTFMYVFRPNIYTP